MVYILSHFTSCRPPPSAVSAPGSALAVVLRGYLPLIHSWTSTSGITMHATRVSRLSRSIYALMSRQQGLLHTSMVASGILTV